VSRGALEDRLCDGVFAALALWTLAAHACVLAGGSLDTLLALGGGSLAAAAALAALRARRRTEAPAVDGPARSRERQTGWSGPSFASRAVCVTAALLAAGFAVAQQLYVFWGLSLAIGVATGLRELRQVPRFPSPRRSRAERGFLLALSLVCVVVVGLAHRPDPDDAYYLNLAVAAADHPGAPLLAGDTLHGVEGVPLTLPIYRVHSIELLGAAVARVTGLEVLTIAHLFLPALFAVLVPVVLARLARKLVPDRWLVATAIALLYLLTAAENGPSFANFAFVRLHQGKAAMLMVAIPLLSSCAMEYARRPSRATWARLAGVQVAAVGLSATALWLAPVVAGLSLATALPLSAWRRGAAGLGASAYVLAVALAMRSETTRTFAQATVGTPELLQRPEALASMAFRSVFGWGPLAYAAMLPWLAGWAFAGTSLLRRMYAFFGLALSLLFWNPFWADWIAAHVTSPPTYWRVMWLLPLPLWVGIVLSAPLRWRQGPRAAGVATCLLATTVALGLGPTYQALSVDNGVSLRAPGWKVPVPAFEAARTLRDRLAPGVRVLAPGAVATWVPTLSDHPYPLLVRPLYTPILEHALSAEALEERRALTAWVEGRVRPPHAERRLADAIRRIPIAGVALTREAAGDAALLATLREGGLAPALRNDEFEVWIRVVAEGADTGSRPAPAAAATAPAKDPVVD